MLTTRCIPQLFGTVLLVHYIQVSSFGRILALLGRGTIIIWGLYSTNSANEKRGCSHRLMVKCRRTYSWYMYLYYDCLNGPPIDLWQVDK